jgi:hypothetical protein
VTGKLVDEERSDLHYLLVEAARRVFPGVLHIDAGDAPPSISVPCTLKTNSPPGIRTMPAGAFGGGFGRRNFDDGLRQQRWLMRTRQ